MGGGALWEAGPAEGGQVRARAPGEFSEEGNNGYSCFTNNFKFVTFFCASQTDASVKAIFSKVMVITSKLF